MSELPFRPEEITFTRTQAIDILAVLTEAEAHYSDGGFLSALADIEPIIAMVNQALWPGQGRI